MKSEQGLRVWSRIQHYAMSQHAPRIPACKSLLWLPDGVSVFRSPGLLPLAGTQGHMARIQIGWPCPHLESHRFYTVSKRLAVFVGSFSGLDVIAVGR